MKRGFTLRDLLIVCFMVGVLVAIAMPVLQKQMEKSRLVKCKANLDQMGKIMKVYLLDFGRNVLFPQKNGAGFLTTLYHEKILAEPKVFLCPKTTDDNKDGKELQNITGPDPNKLNAVSYAGRKNAMQHQYPGIFKPQKWSNDVSPIGADDSQKEDNHINLIFFLFPGGNVDHINRMDEKTVKEAYDPLTN